MAIRNEQHEANRQRLLARLEELDKKHGPMPDHSQCTLTTAEHFESLVTIGVMLYDTPFVNQLAGRLVLDLISMAHCGWTAAEKKDDGSTLVS